MIKVKVAFCGHYDNEAVALKFKNLLRRAEQSRAEQSRNSLTSLIL